MGKKLTIDCIRQEFLKEGYQLLSTEYHGYQTKLDFICPNGHRDSISWTNFQQEYRCYQCRNKKDFNLIRQAFLQEGYVLLSAMYVNAGSKLSYACSQGHKGEISWNKFQQGCRCVLCFRERQKIMKSMTVGLLQSEGYVLFLQDIFTAKDSIDFLCPQGHRGAKSLTNFQQGHRCAECKGNKKKSKIL